MAADLDAGKLSFSCNGKWYPSKWPIGADPSGTRYELYPALSGRGTFRLNLGADPFGYQPPDQSYAAIGLAADARAVQLLRDYCPGVSAHLNQGALANGWSALSEDERLKTTRNDWSKSDAARVLVASANSDKPGWVKAAERGERLDIGIEI